MVKLLLVCLAVCVSVIFGKECNPGQIAEWTKTLNSPLLPLSKFCGHKVIFKFVEKALLMDPISAASLNFHAAGKDGGCSADFTKTLKSGKLYTPRAIDMKPGKDSEGQDLAKGTGYPNNGDVKSLYNWKIGDCYITLLCPFDGTAPVFTVSVFENSKDNGKGCVDKINSLNSGATMEEVK